MIVIQPATREQIPGLTAFVMTARAEIFPMLDPSAMPADLAAFEQTYLTSPDGAFLCAWDNDELVAVMGYLAYDGRFAQLDFDGMRTVEVVRLYVVPRLRRGGLASALFSALEQRAVAAGIERLYLHTHPFLPGAIRFWQRQGFEVLDVEDDPLWRTTHMSRRSGLQGR